MRRGSRRTGLALLALIGLVTLTLVQWDATGSPPAFDGSQDRAGMAMQRQPVAFVPNRGQVDRVVRYEARGAGFGFFFTPRKVSLVFAAGSKKQSLDLRFLGARGAALVPGRRLTGTVNYLRGKDRSQWQEALPTYGSLTYKGLWPGVDMVFRGANGKLKYEFVVRPGASASSIRLAYEGARRLTVAGGGSLLIHTQAGTLRDARPRSYQRFGGHRVPVESRYAPARGTTRYGFDVGPYDSARPLVIDPGLTYSTFLGGLDDELAADVAVDQAGNSYVMGGTQSPDFPVTPGAVDTTYNGVADVFVTKLDASGSQVLYSTYLGGAGFDSTLFSLNGAVYVDQAGSAYIAGTTESPDFPTTPGAFDRTHTGRFDNEVFIAKLTPGGSLAYSTLLGSTERDNPGDILVDANGNAYVTGTTRSPGFPTTPGAFQRQKECCDADVFLTKLNPAGSALVFSTLIVGTEFEDGGGGLALDPNGDVYVSGGTDGGFPTTPGAYDRTLDAENLADGDGFVAKLDATGSVLLHSTYLGGGKGDGAANIALDDDSGVYVAGYTESADFPTTPGAYDTSFSQGGNFAVDTFVTKLDPALSRLEYSTFLGGSGDEFPAGIELDSHRNAYVAGFTNSADLATTPDAFDRTYNGGGESKFDGDGFVTQLDSQGANLLYSTYLGGSDDDSVNGFDLASDGAVHLAGHTESREFPTTSGAFDTEFHGGRTDAWAAKLVTTPGNTPCRIRAHGKLASNPKARFNLYVTYTAGDQAPVGRVSYSDRKAGVTFRLLSLDSLIGSGTHATIRGQARLGGDPGDFRIELDDLDPRGRDDQFEIRLSSGYVAAGTLRNGDVTIDCGGA